MKRLLVSLLPAILSTPHVAPAQASRSPFESGTRVRLFVVDTINQASGEIRYTYPAGRIAGFASGSLILRSDSTINRPGDAADTLRIPVTHIGSVEAFTGLKRHAVLGAIVGLVVGGTAGYIVGQPSYGHRYVCDPITFRCQTVVAHPDKRLSTGGSYGGLGALAGAGVGYLIRTEQWSRVDVGQLRLQLGLR